MAIKNEWEEFFDGHAPVYMDNVFTKNTLKEVDFVLAEFKLPPNSRILDMGCGTGRHAVELARRGYRVTGVDISSGMLAEAEMAARKAGVEVEWIHADATTFKSTKQYDAAICLCEGAFGLIGPKDNPCDHDLVILGNIYNALKPGAKFILTALNGCRLIRKFSREDVKRSRFDPLTMVEVSTMEYDTAEGKKTIMVREGGHVPSELVFLLRQAGFSVEHIGGGTAGNWGRRPLDLDEIEMMVIARTSGGIA
jgi:cyclopropane fatty-acyl-phospholipid synthase-like methyltransferase